MVCGQLLTLHWKGNRVDLDALRDRISLQQDAEKGPKMGSHGNRRLRQWRSFFVDVREFIEVELGQTEPRVPH